MKRAPEPPSIPVSRHVVFPYWPGATPQEGDHLLSISARTASLIVGVARLRREGDLEATRRFRLTVHPAIRISQIPAGAHLHHWPSKPKAPAPAAPAPRGVEAIEANLRRMDANDARTASRPALRPDRPGHIDLAPSVQRAVTITAGGDVRGSVERLVPTVILHDRADPHRPNVTVHGARRYDPLIPMLKAGTITPQQAVAADRYRTDCEVASGALPMSDRDPWGDKVDGSGRRDFSPSELKCSAQASLDRARAIVGEPGLDDLMAFRAVVEAQRSIEGIAREVSRHRNVIRDAVVKALARLVPFYGCA